MATKTTIAEFKATAEEAVDEFVEAYVERQAEEGRKTLPDRQPTSAWWDHFIAYLKGEEDWERDDEDEDDGDDDDEDSSEGEED